MVKIIPAILTSDIHTLTALLERSEGAAERVQIDVIDGVFADNKTISPEALYNISTTLLLDFHLMVSEPASWVEKCIRAGADRIIGQIEKMKSQEEFVAKVQSTGAKVGLALDVETSVSALDAAILRDTDAVLVMSVPAGFGGQEFRKNALEKIEKLNEIKRGDSTPFSVIDDGGITLETVDDVAYAGVDEVAIGRRIFEGDIAENIRRFQKASL